MWLPSARRRAARGRPFTPSSRRRARIEFAVLGRRAASRGRAGAAARAVSRAAVGCGWPKTKRLGNVEGKPVFSGRSPIVVKRARQVARLEVFQGAARARPARRARRARRDHRQRRKEFMITVRMQWRLHQDKNRRKSKESTMAADGRPRRGRPGRELATPNCVGAGTRF
ncbi:hypothetical protein EVAR_69711_1 [Eumeta japonica]|uniref:Uncharacterized protein n=1 Tax=Eumeta variegata TaxID=151549 RepID=A0A4C1T7N1_EUMVA|nr:hypothetical protein EVAR_69711_1 [Eumeta japonica]